MPTKLPAKFYELADRLTIEERNKIPRLKVLSFNEKIIFEHNNVRAQKTGEFRCPRQGEWYLSGAIVQAWRTPNDLTSPYHIAKLVVIETKTVVTHIITQTL